MSEQPSQVSLEIEPIAPGARYTGTQVDTALTLLGVVGDSVRASRELRAMGIKVAASTLRNWRTNLYPRRYRALAQRHAPDIDRAIAAQARETALLAGNAAQEAI